MRDIPKTLNGSGVYIHNNFIKISLARCVITIISKFHPIIPTLEKLPWLPIKQRIYYKLCLLTYKALTNQQPTYIYNSLPFPSHSVPTRSSDSLVLSFPYVRSSLGKRAFCIIGPRLWNATLHDTRNSTSLPKFAVCSPTAWNNLSVDLRDPYLSLSCFRKKLGTYLFQLSSIL